MDKKTLDNLMMWLLIVGGLNWGLVGLMDDWNVVHMLLGSVPMLEKLVYLLIGASALVVLLEKLGVLKIAKK